MMPSDMAHDDNTILNLWDQMYTYEAQLGKTGSWLAWSCLGHHGTRHRRKLSAHTVTNCTWSVHVRFLSDDPTAFPTCNLVQECGKSVSMGFIWQSGTDTWKINKDWNYLTNTAIPSISLSKLGGEWLVSGQDVRLRCWRWRVRVQSKCIHLP